MSGTKKLNVAFLTTYPPRECGIATFTQDIINELKKSTSVKTGVIAITDQPMHYGEDVRLELKQHDRTSYIETARKINRSDIDVLVVEHEYGIYGGECGEYLLDLIELLEKPIVTTLHTVLPSPSDKQREILKQLCAKSEKVVTMAMNSRKVLEDVYDVDSSKIELIHHGVPDLKLPERDELKKELGLENRIIISTFGLISPGKGLEYGIEAVAQTAKKHPEVLYLILGQTHPVIRKQHGEVYRNSLEKMVRELQAEDNVRFVNRYLTKEEIIRYLKLSDIYMTPYLGKDQAVSGTLAYAVGCGRIIVSTPYSYAKEMLADGRGLLADFEDSASLSECINYVIEHPERKKQMEQKTKLLGDNMKWSVVADCYRRTFYKAYREYSKKERVAV
ncbi:glycosyltransferase family 4 protein [[Clostridium] cellulosi]